MMTKAFSIELLQAVNDWQRGSSSEAQRARRAAALQAAAQKLPAKFRKCGLTCFRQVALKKGHLWDLLAKKHLAERVSSWTPSIEVAKSFKGGVPPGEWRGVILMITPKPEQVVLNLSTLYQSQEFRQFDEENRPKIKGYHDGIGRYGASQSEVVLEIPNVGPDEIWTMGGYSSDKTVLSRLFLGREPNTAEQRWIDENIAQSGVVPGGPWWLSADGWQNVYARIKPKIEELKRKEN
ncbi:MAG: hypothetical protein O9296_16255 [Novosphingobium sp.]|nr:hypothetical protein [Novosphingobium sp.]